MGPEISTIPIHCGANAASLASVEIEEAIIALQLRLLADHLDTLIARKCGIDMAVEASRRARLILQESNTVRLTERESVRDFDRWLRADGNRRNPGTTADLVTACLFAALREGVISPPLFARTTGRAGRR